MSAEYERQELAALKASVLAWPPGRNRDRTRLWDRQWRLIWDSATATTPAYQHISDFCNATIDYPGGVRWGGYFYRCPEGIKRGEHPPIPQIYEWVNPFAKEDQ